LALRAGDRRLREESLKGFEQVEGAGEEESDA
jgi:hypothetical protein